MSMKMCCFISFLVCVYVCAVRGLQRIYKPFRVILFHQQNVIELNEYLQRENCENKHNRCGKQRDNEEKKTKLLIDKLTLIFTSFGINIKITGTFPNFNKHFHYNFFPLLFFSSSVFHSTHFVNSKQQLINKKSSNNAR